MNPKTLLWAGAGMLVLVLLALDLGVFRRKSGEVPPRRALVWSAVWIALALTFNAGIYHWLGSAPALQFFTGYLIEKVLSVDNLLVFLAIFGSLAVPKSQQYRVLFWGIFGALLLRAIFILIGAALLQRFHWIIYVFGGILVFTGIQLFRQRSDEAHPERSAIYRFVTRIVPSTTAYYGNRFFIREKRKWVATPLFAALLMITVADVVFAIDSIPAIFAVTSDPFLILTSNLFAMLGLRSLFFVLADAMSRFTYLTVGLAGVLCLVGIKMLITDVYQVPIAASLGAIVLLLGGSVLLSILRVRTAWSTRKRLRNIFRWSLWIVPAVTAIAAFLSAPVLRAVDRSSTVTLLHYTAEGAHALAGIVAAAMISFIVLFFSVLMLTVQIASSALSPRIITRPFRSPILKGSLGLFVFTLIASMALVVRPSSEPVEITTTVVIVLTIASTCVFLYVVEQVTKQLRPVSVMADVSTEGIRVIREVYPTLLGHDVREPEERSEVTLEAPSQTLLYSGKPGVLLSFDLQALLALAARENCAIELVPQVGDFLGASDPAFRLYGTAKQVQLKELLRSVALGRERTLEQDPAFAFRMIIDIATKALSPAINDPTTAVIAIDQIHILLHEVGLRRLDDGFVRDHARTVRIVCHTPNWEDFVGLATTELRQFGGSSIQVVRRMRAMLENLISTLPAERSAALNEALALLRVTVERGFPLPEDRARAETPDFQGLGGHRSVPGASVSQDLGSAA